MPFTLTESLLTDELAPNFDLLNCDTAIGFLFFPAATVLNFDFDKDPS